MKLEKLSDNKIRCIIDHEDLEERDLDISELIQRSDKAQELFQDMMQQAASELDFEVNNFPIMVEAAPISNDCVIFVITRVDNAEELKERLPDISNVAHLNIEIQGDGDIEDFSFDTDLSLDPDDMEDDMEALDILDYEDSELSSDHADEQMPAQAENTAKSSKEEPFDILGMFNEKIAEAKKELARKKQEKEKQTDGIQIYCFDHLNQVIALSASLAPFFDGESQLYKDPADSTYYLALLQNDSDPDLFSRACTITSDYGHSIEAGYNSLAYFTEHFKAVHVGDAIGYLNELN